MKTVEIKENLRNAVLAGLGVVSIAQKEAAKVYGNVSKEANKIYGNLLKEGQSLEKKSKKSVNEITSQAEGKLKNIKGLASKQFAKIENVFESKVESALNKLDIPTVADLQGLTKRVDTLIKEIKKIDKKAA